LREGRAGIHGIPNATVVICKPLGRSGEIGCLEMHDLLHLENDTSMFGSFLIPLVRKLRKLGYRAKAFQNSTHWR
jgi:hypothetical protein